VLQSPVVDAEVFSLIVLSDLQIGLHQIRLCFFVRQGVIQAGASVDLSGHLDSLVVLSTVHQGFVQLGYSFVNP